MDWIADGRMIGAAISGTIVLPMLAFNGAPDPLTGTVLSSGAGTPELFPLL